MKPYPRSERIGIKIQSAISELMNRKLDDPRLEMATISRVKMSRDLRVAYVYIALFGDQEKIQLALDGFKRSRGFIKKSIAPVLGLKYMPDLKFVRDDFFDKSAKLDSIIQEAVRDIDG